MNYNNLQGHAITGYPSILPSIKWIRPMALVKKYSSDSGPELCNRSSCEEQELLQLALLIGNRNHGLNCIANKYRLCY